jgi:hypothetical protein
MADWRSRHTCISLVSVAGLLIVSLIDDIRGMPVLARLAAHLSGQRHGRSAHPLSWPRIACNVRCNARHCMDTNLYNFMDGSDGPSRVEWRCSLGFYGIAAWH